MATQKQRILDFLKSGKSLSKYHAEHRMHIANPREYIRQLRQEGHVIYTNRGPDLAANYRLGSPKRSIISGAYNRHGAVIFN
jgi:hypothetical protein